MMSFSAEEMIKYLNDTILKDKFIDEEVNEIIKICIKYPYMFVAYRFNESFEVLEIMFVNVEGIAAKVVTLNFLIGKLYGKLSASRIF